jgi:NADH dehydrogenase
VVGAGFGGINATKVLANGPFDVVLVDRHNYHEFAPLLYQVATAGLGPEDIAHPVRELFGGRPNVRIRLGTVVRTDLEPREVVLDDGARIPYDFLVLAAGSSIADFGVPGVDKHAFPLKSLDDAIWLRNHVLRCFEEADANPQLAAPGALTIVLVGGGPTGVEMAGALAELVARNLARDFTHLDVTGARIVVVETADHLLGGFSPASQHSALTTLEGKGVEVRLGTTIRRVHADHVELADGTTIPCATVVWTAGVEANALASTLDVPHTRTGVGVGPDLALPGHPEVFVVGDLAASYDKHGDRHPQVAQVAIQGGRHAARSIHRLQEGKATRRFRYHDHGMMATIGRRAAVAELPGGVALRGTPGWVAWLGVHIVFLVGFRNRAVVLISWAWNYLTWDRASRVIFPDRR